MQNHLRLGSWNLICDICGQKKKAEDIKRRWDNYLVCNDDWERQHPSDLLRVPKEKGFVPYSFREPPDSLLPPICSVEGCYPLADLGTADCARLSYNNTPSITNTPPLDMLIWYDASILSSITKNGSNWVSQWKDLSGNNIHATHVAYPNCTHGTGTKFGGKNAVYFGGIDGDQSLSISSCPASDTWTIISALSWSTTGGYGAIGIRSNNDNAYGIRSEFNSDLVYLNRAVALTGTSISYAASSAVNKVSTENHVLTTRWTPASGSALIRVDGLSLSKPTFDNTSGSQSVALTNLGAGGAGTSYQANGNAIGEILCYNRALSTTEIQSVEAYLKAKWGTA